MKTNFERLQNKIVAWKKPLTITVLALGLSLAGQNCDNVRLSLQKPIEQSSVIGNLFGTLEPVLAVRNTACIMCHAQINGDVITDFGAGNTFFLGADDGGINHPLQTDYGPFSSRHFIAGGQTWRDSSIMGNVYIPDLEIKDERMLEAYTNPLVGNAPVSGPLKLVDFLNGKFMDPTISVAVPAVLIDKSASTDMNVPGLRGQFIPRKTIVIDSPTATEIKNLELSATAQQVLAKPGVVIFKGTKDDVISGLSIVQSQNTSRLIVTNTEPVKCKGDVIIEGTLFLNNMSLATDDAGCRLYVTGSVFIQGAITYTSGGDSNLQITSSRAIIMGMRDLKGRLTQKGSLAAISGARGAETDDLEITLYKDIFNDRDSVDDLKNDAGPMQIMVDPSSTQILAVQSDFDNDVWVAGPGQSSFPDPKTCVIGTPTATDICGINWTGGYDIGLPLRKTVNYTHLLLNAPTIHSRYLGVFQGVVIGDNVLFAVGNFSFEKDAVLFRTQLLPLLQNRVFKMSDN